MELLRSIFPVRWFPPFRRGDWSVEEIAETRLVKVGNYDSAKIPDVTAFFEDKAHGKKCYIKFQSGTIWLETI